MSSNSNVTVAAPAFPVATILTIVFVVLKLTDVIAWSWWWVLSPLWISFGIGLVVLLIALAAIVIVDSRSKTRARKRREQRGAARRPIGTPPPRTRL